MENTAERLEKWDTSSSDPHDFCCLGGSCYNPDTRNWFWAPAQSHTWPSHAQKHPLQWLSGCWYSLVWNCYDLFTQRPSTWGFSPCMGNRSPPEYLGNIEVISFPKHICPIWLTYFHPSSQKKQRETSFDPAQVELEGCCGQNVDWVWIEWSCSLLPFQGHFFPFLAGRERENRETIKHNCSVRFWSCDWGRWNKLKWVRKHSLIFIEKEFLGEMPY